MRRLTFGISWLNYSNNSHRYTICILMLLRSGSTCRSHDTGNKSLLSCPENRKQCNQYIHIVQSSASMEKCTLDNLLCCGNRIMGKDLCIPYDLLNWTSLIGSDKSLIGKYCSLYCQDKWCNSWNMSHIPMYCLLGNNSLGTSYNRSHLINMCRLCTEDTVLHLIQNILYNWRYK